jgi:hypothetical protein
MATTSRPSFREAPDLPGQLRVPRRLLPQGPGRRGEAFFDAEKPCSFCPGAQRDSHDEGATTNEVAGPDPKAWCVHAISLRRRRVPSAKAEISEPAGRFPCHYIDENWKQIRRANQIVPSPVRFGPAARRKSIPPKE